MSPTPLYGMGVVTKIEFTDALARLQGMLGQDVQVLVNFHGTFGGCTLRGQLTRVQTIPPDNSAVSLLIDERQTVTLDPLDTETFLVSAQDGRGESLDFHLPSGVAITLERC